MERLAAGEAVTRGHLSALERVYEGLARSLCDECFDVGEYEQELRPDPDADRFDEWCNEMEEQYPNSTMGDIA